MVKFRRHEEEKVKILNKNKNWSYSVIDKQLFIYFWSSSLVVRNSTLRWISNDRGWTSSPYLYNTIVLPIELR
jgi:hypothetical protein